MPRGMVAAEVRGRLDMDGCSSRVGGCGKPWYASARLVACFRKKYVGASSWCAVSIRAAAQRICCLAAGRSSVGRRSRSSRGHSSPISRPELSPDFLQPRSFRGHILPRFAHSCSSRLIFCSPAPPAARSNTWTPSTAGRADTHSSQVGGPTCAVGFWRCNSPRCAALRWLGSSCVEKLPAARRVHRSGLGLRQTRWELGVGGMARPAPRRDRCRASPVQNPPASDRSSCECVSVPLQSHWQP